MAKFKCIKCTNTINLKEYKMIIHQGEIVSPQAKCCDYFMQPIRSNKGLGGIIKKPNGTVSGKF
jgi:hypothetical protein